MKFYTIKLFSENKYKINFRRIISTQTDPELKRLSTATAWPDKSEVSFTEALQQRKRNHLIILK